MGTEDWILKGTKLRYKYQKAKIKNLEQSLEFQKYNIKEKKKKKSQKINIYMKFALKNRVSLFFCKVIVSYKNENQSDRGLNFFLI